MLDNKSIAHGPETSTADAPPRDPTVGLPKGLSADRIHGSLEEAREMVAYNERIIADSGSRQRRHRAARMLVNLRPHVERLEAEETARVARIEAVSPPAGTFDDGVLQRFRDAGEEAREMENELEVVWDGARGRAGRSLTGGDGLGSSLAPGQAHRVRGLR